MPRSNAVLLKVEGLEKRFGGIVALADYDVEIRPGELVGLIGPNGAGKTTLLRTISGLLRPKNGSILYQHPEQAVSWRAMRKSAAPIWEESNEHRLHRPANRQSLEKVSEPRVDDAPAAFAMGTLADSTGAGATVFFNLQL